MNQHVLFEVAGLELAVPTNRVRHIHEQLPVEKVAGTHDWFLGLAVSRGRLLPVSDLGAFIGRQHCHGRTLELHTDTALVGLRVGEVAGVCKNEPIDADKAVDSAEYTCNLTFTGKMVRDNGRVHPVLDVAALLQLEAFNQIREPLS